MEATVFCKELCRVDTAPAMPPRGGNCSRINLPAITKSGGSLIKMSKPADGRKVKIMQVRTQRCAHMLLVRGVTSLQSREI